MRRRSLRAVVQGGRDGGDFNSASSAAMETVAASTSAADTLARSGWVVAGFCVLGACAASDLSIRGKILLAAKASQAFTSVVELDALRKQEKQEWPFAEVSGTVQEL